ncbi:Trihelix transcription factor GT-1 [Camellia lanceoleosa]|uniref:Trihelix transcription factor GT-1 n=1 Tax=Camellia lanceoleosa TaxID=1840588 RepID=A0ACC0I466_9ERIC|nr:Trihelix transcription factor GT-1 [Camellia lanceoleosa]
MIYQGLIRTSSIRLSMNDSGLEDGNIPFGSVEASGRSTVNLERSLDHDGDPLAIATSDAVAASGVPPWNWRETPGNGGEGNSLMVEGHSKGSGVNTLEGLDEDNVIRSLDKDMPLGNYTLHLDEGLREINGYRTFDNLDDLRPGAMYQGVRLLLGD